jgi:hypothetical protein
MTSAKLDHSVGGYLCYARDQLPNCTGELSCWGFNPSVKNVMFEEVANMIAQGYKQCGNKYRRDLMREAESGEPHGAFPDPTPYECQVLLEELDKENYHEWCTDEYAVFEDEDDEETEVEN